MSRRLGMVAIVAALAACASDGHGPRPAAYTVSQGETLYSIAWRYGLDYERVARWNRIDSPYTIFPGQRLRLNPPAHATPAPSRQSSRVATRKPTPNPSRGRPRAPAEPELDWRWPVTGEIVNGFGQAGSGGKGIDISGRPGQAIRAASPGKVVYSGSGLAGYGELIILKHAHEYLSAYAHNRRLVVKEGDRVRAGQMIAELGSTGATRPMLHFEIRRAGRPVDPMRYLPAR